MRWLGNSVRQVNNKWAHSIFVASLRIDLIHLLNVHNANICSKFSEGYFSHVLIDEAAQAAECEAMIPIAFVNLNHGQVIMAGDPLQLPPITLSSHAKFFGLDKSMLQRYLEAYEQMDGVIPVSIGCNSL